MSERILVCIPCIVNPHVIKECVQSILYKPDVHIILLDNGADQDVKDLLSEYAKYENVNVWQNHQNEYVTKAWNLFMNYFLQSELWDRLIIMNSDLVMQKEWDRIIRTLWRDSPDLILSPNVVEDKTKLYDSLSSNNHKEVRDAPNPPGIFITLNKRQTSLVHPIPEEIKIWFNDGWIYKILNSLSYYAVTPLNLIAFHHTSESIKRVPEAREIIEQDKIAWRDIVEPKMQEKINQLKQTLT